MRDAGQPTDTVILEGLPHSVSPEEVCGSFVERGKLYKESKLMRVDSFGRG
jgi:hypothetical protein